MYDLTCDSNESENLHADSDYNDNDDGNDSGGGCGGGSDNRENNFRS